MRVRRGFALITAIAIALVCFLLVTVMVAVARFESGGASAKAVGIRRYFAARGQVQDLICRLNNGAPIADLCGPPQTQEVDGITVTTEVVADASTSGVYHLLARVEGQTLVETAIHIGQPAGGGSFASELSTDPLQPAALSKFPRRFYQQSSQGAWSALPELPMQAYDGSGAAVSASRVSPYYAADARGHLVVSTESYDGDGQPAGIGLYRYGPELGGGAGGWEDLGPVPRLVLITPGIWQFHLSPDQSEVRPLSWALTPAGGSDSRLALTQSGSELYEALEMGGGSVSFRMRDMATGAWSLIDGPGDLYYDNDGNLIQFEERALVTYVAGAAESGVVCGFSNVVARLRDPAAAPPQWECLPPFPRNYYDSSGTLHQEGGYLGYNMAGVVALAVGPSDEVYAGLTVVTNNAIMLFKYDGREWHAIRPPLDQPVSWGDHLSVDGNGVLNLSLSQNAWQGWRYDGEVWREVPDLPLSPNLRYKVIGSAGEGGGSGRVLKTIAR